jgi:Tol biopolymer transport system component
MAHIDLKTFSLGLALTLLADCGGGGGTATATASSTSSSSASSSASSSSNLASPAIVYAASTASTSPGVQEVFISAADGSGAVQLTNDNRLHFLPHFSPDGTKILYTKYVSGTFSTASPQTDIAVLDLASHTETLLTHTGDSWQAVWSPDGKSIAFGKLSGTAFWLMNADGSNPHQIGSGPSGQPDDVRWNDLLWSSDNWIYFAVGEGKGGCGKVRLDRMRPDGSSRTQITDGGPNCTPAGLEQSGDADPGISADGKTIYSSRGLPRTVPGHPELTVRHLFKIDATPWVAGKVETDLSAATKDNCISGVPKVAPDNARILLFLSCADDPSHTGVTRTDPNGSAFSFIIGSGFGADWNPAHTGP